MLKTILLLICSVLVVDADPVSFAWNHNTESDLAGYRLYTGAQPYVGSEVVIMNAGQNRVTVDMPPGHYAWLTAFSTAALESESSSALLYRPMIVEMVLEGADEITGSVFFPSSEVQRWEIFRLPDVLFDPVMAEIPSRLNITRSRVEIITDTRTYQTLLDTLEGQKFFRSFVAARLF